MCPAIKGLISSHFQKDIDSSTASSTLANIKLINQEYSPNDSVDSNPLGCTDRPTRSTNTRGHMDYASC